MADTPGAYKPGLYQRVIFWQNEDSEHIFESYFEIWTRTQYVSVYEVCLKSNDESHKIIL